MAIKPNLPDKPVKTVLMSGSVPSLVENLQCFGIEAIKTERIHSFLPFEQTHADMQFLPINEDTCAVYPIAVILLKS